MHTAMGWNATSLLEQRDGRVSVDGVVAANYGLQPFQVNGPIDIDAPSPGVGGDYLLLATLDPTAGSLEGGRPIPPGAWP